MSYFKKSIQIYTYRYNQPFYLTFKCLNWTQIGSNRTQKWQNTTVLKNSILNFMNFETYKSKKSFLNVKSAWYLSCSFILPLLTCTICEHLSYVTKSLSVYCKVSWSTHTNCCHVHISIWIFRSVSILLQIH